MGSDGGAEDVVCRFTTACDEAVGCPSFLELYGSGRSPCTGTGIKLHHLRRFNSYIKVL